MGVWQMAGWFREPGAEPVNVSSQVNGNVHMNYFVELAYIDLRAEGFEQQIWGTSTLGYDANDGYSISTRFNTLAEAVITENGTFDTRNRRFVFSGSDYSVTIQFETPDLFTVETRSGNQVVESYQFTRT